MEHTRNSKPYRLYANDSTEGPLSNRSSEIAVLISRVEIFNFEKIDSKPKIFESSLEDQCPFWNI